MNWLNLEIKNLTSHEFLGSEPLDRATWLCLMRFCAQQENSGIIQDCKEWGERKWMQLIGISKDEISRESMLWSWSDNSIEVWQYPLSQQLATQAKRNAGKNYGKGKDNSKGNSNSNSNSNSKDELTGSNKLSESLANSSAKNHIESYKDISERYRDAYKKQYPDFANEIDRNYNEDSWCKEIDSLIRLDQHSRQDIIDVLMFALKDDFWSVQLRSLATLRKKGKNECKKFDNIKAKMLQKQASQPKPTIDPNKDIGL